MIYITFMIFKEDFLLENLKMKENFSRKLLQMGSRPSVGLNFGDAGERPLRAIFSLSYSAITICPTIR